MSKLKVLRAKEKMEELSTKLRAFRETDPYKISTKRDPQTRKLIYYISEAQQVPLEISLVVGEIIHSLRSALDHLAYSLFKMNTPTGDEGKHIYFPISDDATKYANEKESKTRGMSQDAKNLIDSFTPYKGGNDILWRLHKLDNIDKHRFLVAVGGSFGSVDLGFVMSEFMKKQFPNQFKDIPALPPMFVKPSDPLFSLKVGDELYIDTPDAEPTNINFKIDIMIYEAGIIEGQTVIDALHSMINEVDRIVTSFSLN